MHSSFSLGPTNAAAASCALSADGGHHEGRSSHSVGGSEPRHAQIHTLRDFVTTGKSSFKVSWRHCSSVLSDQLGVAGVRVIYILWIDRSQGSLQESGMLGLGLGCRCRRRRKSVRSIVGGIWMNAPESVRCFCPSVDFDTLISEI